MTRTIEFEVDDPAFGHFDVRAEVSTGDKGDRDTPPCDPECVEIDVRDMNGHKVMLNLHEWHYLRERAISIAIEKEEARHTSYDEE